jgi:predicted DNA-binding ribbon-helix-helix protein
VIQSLEFTTAPDRKFIDTLDSFRKKRNISSYDLSGAISDKEANEMANMAKALRRDAHEWIVKSYPELL